MNSPSRTSDGQSHFCPVCDEERDVETLVTVDDAPCDRCGHLRWFRIQKLDDAIILNVLPDMDRERVNGQRVGKLLGRFQSPLRVIVNLSLIEWISSTFVSETVRLLKAVKADNGRLTLCGAGPYVREVFRVTNLEALFDFADDENAALDELS